MSHEITANNSFAAIDLGSNSFHMAVAGGRQAHLQMIDKLRRPVRLGSGLDANNVIQPETMERALECLSLFQQRLRGVPRSHIRVVGTNTLRRARNADVFNAAAERILGVPIDIISGREEARLIFAGVTYGTRDNKKRLVIDIGGSSTEIIAGTGTKPKLMGSINAGCVVATEHWFTSGEPLPKQFEKAVKQTQIELQPLTGKYIKHEWDHCIGSSGTIKATEKILCALGISDRGITAQGLQQLIKLLGKKGISALKNIDFIGEDRRSVIIGGLSVLLATFRSLDIEFMGVSHAALREGVLVELGDDKPKEHVRMNAVIDLQQRFLVDVDQATRVSDTAELLFNKVRKPWRLSRKHDLSTLLWACDLHEIGLSVSHVQYHKHGEYLLRNADLLGFSRNDQMMLASLVRNHRRKVAIEFTGGLSASDQKRYPYLLVLLRLAILLQRTRGVVSTPALELIVEKKSLTIELPAQWLASHPLTGADLRDEIAPLKALGFQLTLLPQSEVELPD
ncbi:hypothetical protein AB833_27620 [Chromatiales bacterium (ex Bugula neritina AB1)]|nr:hypothetical protein AB833_27620 [Chromatiales bacterium (ex Bugula neritina AB1)]